MGRKLKDRQQLTFFDYFVPIFIMLSLIDLIRGDVYRYFDLGIIAVAIVAQLIRLLIQRHNYRRMSPTEKEFYLENCSPLAYQPLPNTKVILTLLFDYGFLILVFAGISGLWKEGYSLYFLSPLAVAIVAELARLLIQKHSYQNMTPTEQELYRENRSLLSYRPGK